MTKFSSDYFLQVFDQQVKNNHRTIFIVIGEGSKYQIPVLHEKLSKISSVGSIIWFYKNAETYMDREAKKIKIAEEDSEFFKWIKTHDPEYISYRESNRVLGRTCDMLILQDFEALTPNMIACSMETVRGGGSIVLLLDREKSINEIINKKSDLVEEMSSYDKPTPRFNRRIFKSLTQSSNAIFLDSKLRVMDITKEINIKNTVKKPVKNLPDQDETPPLLKMCKTFDQFQVLKGLIALTEDAEASISSVIASRGRGKSVALGLAISNSLDKNYSNIAISALFLENVQEIFNFILKGLNTLGYRKITDYKAIYSFEGKKRLISRIEVTKDINRFVEFVHPIDEMKFYPALVVIDEAASIPLPQLKTLLNYRKVFMATTANGYEGTGRMFRTKLGDYLKEKSFKCNEFQMNEPIRYSPDDPIEAWIGKSLLLDPKIQNIQNSPIPSECSMHFVNKDALFSNHSKTEEFLEEVFSLFVSSHYRNSPNDMQILSDSPNHEILVLLTPASKVVCAMQIAFEGNCQKSSFNKEGNLIPWVIFDNFGSEKVLQSFGIRIVRIAVHPSLMSMGYGSHSLNCLMNLIEISSHSDTKTIKFSDSSALLHPLSKIKFPAVDWIGASFGLNEKLLNFWKKSGFSPVCIKQTPSKTTGEFSVVVLKNIGNDTSEEIERIKYLFLQRFIPLLSGSFRNFSPTLVLSLIYSSHSKVTSKIINFSDDEIERLKQFSKGIIDIKNVLDILPDLTRFFFYQKDLTRISIISQTALVMIGGQCKSADEACKFLKMEYFKLIGNLNISIANILEFYKF
jgi:N-acetyltransferase 10